MVVTEWVAAAGGTVVAALGLAFGWYTNRGAQAQTAALAQANNEHSRALAELTYTHARSLETMRYEQQAREHRRVRVADAYEEIAQIVIGSARELDAGGRSAEGDGFSRALALVALHANPPIREAFDGWHERYQKLLFAAERLARAQEISSSGGGPEHDRTTETWRMQVRDGRLREADARERLLSTMAGQLHVGEAGLGRDLTPGNTRGVHTAHGA